MKCAATEKQDCSYKMAWHLRTLHNNTLNPEFMISFKSIGKGLLFLRANGILNGNKNRIYWARYSYPNINLGWHYM